VTSGQETAPVDVSELLRRAVANRPEAVAIRDDFGASLTYSELGQLTGEIEQRLVLAGVRARTVVSLVLPNTAAFAAAFIAARSIGAAVNPIAPFYGVVELMKMLSRADPSVVVVAADYRGRAMVDELAAAGVRGTVLVVPLTPACPPARLAQRTDRDVRRLPPSVDLLVFTSGSEGTPKGVMHSSMSFAHASRAACRMSGLGPGDVFMTAAPLAHLTGMFSGFRSPLEVGGTVVLLDRWNPARALDCIEQYGVTYMHGPPTMLIDLARMQREAPRAVDTLRQFRSAGAALAPSVVEEAEAALDLHVVRGYGASETLIVTNSNLADDAALRIGTDGAIIDGVEVELRAGPRGDELLVRGATRFQGYLPMEPDADIEDAVLDADAWFETGDLVEIVGDTHLRVVGRTKDIIIRGGLNISAAEVEQALMRHPQIEDAAVVAIPDPRLGERCCAVIVVDEARVTLDSVRLFLQAQGLATFKVPERLRFVSELPRTANGKVAKEEVRRIAAAEDLTDKENGK
jgi:cyclohexanecarboxylate-CoA ligase